MADPRTQLERRQNKEMLEMAKKIRFEHEQELKEDKLGYRLKKEEVEVNYLDWIAEYHTNYTKATAIRFVAPELCSSIS